ncbi:peroxidase [Acyrthosiphon pisum]|uniref:Peroxidase n=1 Tax=Acyrthosiphon pisum TaxID=7029 RepID=A0A8R1W2G7_ACYPI|nr:peroxidase [Acyrthosiphon pisum]|eukprot:XP_001946575.2 PREDICTED: peroxidase [Acyrthosiphon pisum]
MVNDIALETWTKNGETTGLLLHRNDKDSKPLHDYRSQLFVIFVIFSVLIITFSISVVDFWSDNDQYVQSLHAIIKSKDHFNMKNREYFDQCAPIVSCDYSDKYRTSNGTCNNPNNPIWGSSNTPFIRLVDAHYSDGISKLRASSDGKPLPSAREIQVKLFLNKQIRIPDKNNQLLMQWGQFIAHDVSNLAIDTNGEDCCAYKNQHWVSRACEATITIPIDDPVYSKYNKTCMQFTRAMTSNNYSCPLQPLTFIDDASHFIDGSQIYGSNDNVVSTLRSFTGGALISVLDNNQEFCPHSSFESSDTNKYLYQSGDSRVNLNLGIALFHNMFLRFHNFVAFKLKTGNAMWSDEKLYQESRRFVGAIIQHITYTQFLPIILGKNYTEDEVLGGNNKYDPTVNPSTSQEFSTGAFRVLHNIVPAQHRFIDSNFTTVQVVNVTDWMNCPYLLQQGSNYDHLLRGLLNTEGRLSQPSYNSLISYLMFHSNNSIGVDLLSYDIQRGRDTGLPPYNKMRQLCGLPVAKSFSDLVDTIPTDDIYDLETLYSTVDDIDFIVGALLETPENDSLVGNTSRCIIGDFFYRSRVGDRFFYDNEGQSGQFSKYQLEVLKSINLDHIICATSSVDNLQKNIFSKVDNGWYSSMKWSCSQKYTIDFKPWEEELYD